MKIPKLCLGTAQFGLPYGITNRDGIVHEKQVELIMRFASEQSIDLIDTAQAYGAAESVLGRTLPSNKPFHIISKLPAQMQTSYSLMDVQHWESAFQESLSNIGLSSFDSFLLHRPIDLAKSGSMYLLDWLRSLRERGLVSRLGVSIYSADDLLLVPQDLLQTVQLPLSLYDQRLLIDGTIDSLSSSGTIIFARSLFLQGLLLSPLNLWPDWVSSESRLHHLRLLEYASSHSTTLLDIALDFARQQASIHAFVIGVCTLQQLVSIYRSWSLPLLKNHHDYRSWALDDPLLTDPRHWPTH